MNSIWQKVKAEIKRQIPAHSFRMWIEPLALGTVKDERFQFICPNTFFRKRMHDHFSTMIRAELERTLGRKAEIEFSIANGSDDPPPTPLEAPQQLPLPNMTAKPYSGRLLHKDYTFDQFVVGRNNDFAYSAALSLAARKDSQQHSLFLLSKTGMGKSHLSQAIGHHILSQFPREHVYYMTAEDFTNEMVSSYKSNSINSFKEKYHKMCDVLLLEDIHHLSGKDRTQIELAHTLDTLFNQNKKIIFSSCYSPAEIPKLNENLRSRLNCGLISTIDPPEYKTRLKILKSFASSNGWSVPDDVAQYLATELSQDVRQLKSGLVGVTAKASLLGCSIDMELAAGVVKNMVNQSQAITIAGIKKLVCKYYNVTHKELVSQSRKQAVVRPRQVGIYLARRYTDEPLQVIGKSFNRYHATALHAIGAVEKGIRQGTPIQRHVEYLSRKLEDGDF